MKKHCPAFALSLIGAWFSVALTASAESPPVILNIAPTGSTVSIQWMANPATTQFVDRAESLGTNSIVWTSAFTASPPSQVTNTWIDLEATNFAQAFYRIRANTQGKIGQTATFTSHYHGVAGTATITDASTITVSNFSYEGSGILVYMILSPNSNFSPYTIISDDLVRGTPYVNETLNLSIPPGTVLEDINYISVWCIEIPISFGDGQFL